MGRAVYFFAEDDVGFAESDGSFGEIFRRVKVVGRAILFVVFGLHQFLGSFCKIVMVGAHFVLLD